jgi:Family of unknown function (DUF6521)
MLPWKQRAFEEANLFNPAFNGGLIVKAVEEFMAKADSPFAFALAFLIPPIVLHRQTRKALPATTVTSLISWLQDNRESLVDFSVRARRLKPFTQEAIMFALAHKTLALDESGGLVVGTNKVVTTKRTMALFTHEAHDIFDRARFLGRWFAGAGTPETIMAAWGVMP